MVGNEKFAEKTFVDRWEQLIMSGYGRRFLWKKTFADSPKITKFTKVSRYTAHVLVSVATSILY